MQVDKAVTHQFSLSLPYILHKPLSTCGMVSQHLGGAWLGFKFCWSQCIPTECHKPISFWTFSVFHAGNTPWTGSSFCLVQLESVRHTAPNNTCNYHELCKTWCTFDCIGSCLGTHNDQDHIRFLEGWQLQLYIFWILWTPTECPTCRD